MRGGYRRGCIYLFCLGNGVKEFCFFFRKGGRSFSLAWFSEASKVGVGKYKFGKSGARSRSVNAGIFRDGQNTKIYLLKL